MTLDLAELARVMGAQGQAAGSVSGYSIDSRTLQAGDLFFALRGPTHDGHDYAAQAAARGASAVVVERGMGLRVADTLEALQQAGRLARERLQGTLVAVTGSAGKTTTKDVIAHLLSASMPVGKTAGNLNNHIGVPLSLLRLPDRVGAAVLELGMNHAGEIRALARLARPHIAVVTNVGHAHMEAFPDGIEGVAKAKRELVEELPADAVAVLNADDPRVSRFANVHAGRIFTFGVDSQADVRAERVTHGSHGVDCTILGVPFRSSLAGRHGLLNLLAGVAVGVALGVSPEQLAETAASLSVGTMRGERFTHGGVTIWNDTYNSNPDAARSMLDLLADSPAQRRVAVLGEMRELGDWSERLHQEVGRHAARRGIDLLIGIHGASRSLVSGAVEAGLPASAAHFCEDSREAGRLLRSLARPGDAILFKGSRGTRVEQALETFLG